MKIPVTDIYALYQTGVMANGYPEFIMFHKWEGTTEYVTHVAYHKGEDEWEVMWGNYYTQFDAALEDFKQRARIDERLEI